MISLRLCPPVYLLPTAILILLLAARSTVFGGSATWSPNPGSNVWNTATNWTPPTVPNGPNDIATFGVSDTTSIENDTLQDIEVNAIVFSAGASAFTIAFGNSSFFEDYRISGAGITNNSGITQNFEIADFGDSATLLFTNSATAGDQTVFTAGPNCCGASSYVFQDTSTAGNATLIANSDGTILFTGDSTGGTSRVEVFGSGSLSISGHNAPGMTVGSIEGDGLVALGSNNLSAGTNNLSTTFSGVIQDGGSFTKMGTGTLTLAGANTYTGATSVNEGSLFVDGSLASEQTLVNPGGLLGGEGFLGGILLNSGIVSPGNSPGTLVVESNYTQTAGGTLRIEVAGLGANEHDLLVVNGSVNLAGTLQISPLNNFQLQVGDQITLLTATGGVSGAFSVLQNPFDCGEIVYLPNSVILYCAPPIALEAAGRQVNGLDTVRLTWNGATSSQVDIYRCVQQNGCDPALIATTRNDGRYFDFTGQTGEAGLKYRYRVCETGTQTCSNTEGVTFPP